MAEDFRCALVLLAAGASTRMGQPKQLLPVAGRPLLRHVAEAAVAAPVAPVVVVLGAFAAEIAPCLEGLPVQIVINPDWPEGIGSSLRAGIAALQAVGPAVDGVVVALADQPDFSAAQVSRLIAAQRATARSIVASQYRGVLMPPALFTAAHFPELLALQGEAGARPLLQSHRDRLATVPLATGRDLDTPADYGAYQGEKQPRA